MMACGRISAPVMLAVLTSAAFLNTITTTTTTAAAAAAAAASSLLSRQWAGWTNTRGPLRPLSLPSPGSSTLQGGASPPREHHPAPSDTREEAEEQGPTRWRRLLDAFVARPNYHFKNRDSASSRRPLLLLSQPFTDGSPDTPIDSWSPGAAFTRWPPAKPFTSWPLPPAARSPTSRSSPSSSSSSGEAVPQSIASAADRGSDRAADDDLLFKRHQVSRRGGGGDDHQRRLSGGDYVGALRNWGRQLRSDDPKLSARTPPDQGRVTGPHHPSHKTGWRQVVMATFAGAGAGAGTEGGRGEGNGQPAANKPNRGGAAPRRKLQKLIKALASILNSRPNSTLGPQLTVSGRVPQHSAKTIQGSDLLPLALGGLRVFFPETTAGDDDTINRSDEDPQQQQQQQPASHLKQQQVDAEEDTLSGISRSSMDFRAQERILDSLFSTTRAEEDDATSSSSEERVDAEEDEKEEEEEEEEEKLSSGNSRTSMEFGATRKKNGKPSLCHLLGYPMSTRCLDKTYPVWKTPQTSKRKNNWSSMYLLGGAIGR